MLNGVLFDRTFGNPPAPLSQEDRARLIGKLPALGAEALLELDDRITGRDFRAEIGGRQ